jgi:hypothetical protein
MVFSHSARIGFGGISKFSLGVLLVFIVIARFFWVVSLTRACHI